MSLWRKGSKIYIFWLEFYSIPSIPYDKMCVYHLTKKKSQMIEAVREDI